MSLIYFSFISIQDRDRKLRIFAGIEHPFNDRPLEPFAMPLRNVREMRPRARRALVRAQKKLEQGNTVVKAKRKKEDADASSGEVNNTEAMA
jgi:large subunit ribosomal protein L13